MQRCRSLAPKPNRCADDNVGGLAIAAHTSDCRRPIDPRGNKWVMFLKVRVKWESKAALLNHTQSHKHGTLSFRNYLKFIVFHLHACTHCPMSIVVFLFEFNTAFHNVYCKSNIYIAYFVIVLSFSLSFMSFVIFSQKNSSFIGHYPIRRVI